MSIQSFINAAKVLYAEGYYEEALCLVCSAVDASAARCDPNREVSSNKKVSKNKKPSKSKKLSPNKNGAERYKTFLSDHFWTLTTKGFPGISAGGMSIKMNTEIANLIPDDDGRADMEQIIYHVLRCGLVHNCDIDSAIEFTDQTIIGNWEAGKFYIPKAIIEGLIAAVEECQM